jgi:microsomal epoxide hydrolase
MLTDPAAHGGEATDAFTVVVPSLPGYTLSFRENQRRSALPEIGAMFHQLMTGLGYARYGAQGGDWGSFVTAWLGAHRAESVPGIHMNLLPLRRDPAAYASQTPEEHRYLSELATFLKEETGYQWIQGTRPQTLAFGLSDSPVGLAAWIIEKVGVDRLRRRPRNALSMDEMLGDIGLYWFTNCIGRRSGVLRPVHGPNRSTADHGPGGLLRVSAREILRPPRVTAGACSTSGGGRHARRRALPRQWNSRRRWPMR